MASMKKNCRATLCSGAPRVVTRIGAVAREATYMAPGKVASIAAPYVLIEKDQSGHSASAPPNVEGAQVNVYPTDIDCKHQNRHDG